MMAGGRDDSKSWISVCHETLYQRQLSSLRPHTLSVRWFPLVEARLDVSCELEEGRCSRMSGYEAVLIFSWCGKFVDRG